jgi:hypothetical protein
VGNFSPLFSPFSLDRLLASDRKLYQQSINQSEKINQFRPDSFKGNYPHFQGFSIDNLSAL